MRARAETTDELYVPTIPFSTAGQLTPEDARRLGDTLHEIAEVYFNAARLAEERVAEVDGLGYDSAAIIERAKAGHVDARLTVRVSGYQTDVAS